MVNIDLNKNYEGHCRLKDLHSSKKHLFGRLFRKTQAIRIGKRTWIND